MFIFSDLNKIKENNSNISLMEFSNFKILNGLNNHHYSGIYFPCRYRHQYTALLQDYIGSFLELKKMYPDLQIIFFKYNESENKKNALRNTKVIEDLVKYFNADVINIDEGNYSFDKIILTDVEVPVFSIEITKQLYDFTPPNELSDEVKTFRINSIKQVVNEFKNYKIKKEDNCLYVSRSLANNHYFKSNNEYIKTNRYHDPAYDQELEEFFNNKKYTVTEFYDKSFFDQINLAYNSKYYISLDGSGLTNAIWCNDNTKIIQIKINKKYTTYNYYWEETLNSVNKKIYKVIDATDLNLLDAIDFIKQEINKLD